MPRRRPQETPPGRSIRLCERWTTNVSWPAPVDRRLTALVDLAIDEDESENLTRSELLAALVLDAPNDGAKLCEVLRRYRRAKAKDAAVGGESELRNVLLLPERRPGRRPTRA